MDISEAETGIMRLDLSETDLGDLVADTITLYSYSASEKGISIVRNQPTPVTANVDVNRFRQVIANLLDNALKYTSEGGTVEVSLRRQRDQALFIIKDTGLGLPLKSFLTSGTACTGGIAAARPQGWGLD